MKHLRLLLWTALLCGVPLALGSLAAAGQKPAAPAPGPRLAEATFAGGCFWCEEATFEGIPGIVSVTSGYTGGHTKNPTYEEVCSGATGHVEAVRILYDPGKTTYARLLDVFWHSVDPTQRSGQFCDRGASYRSAVFYHDETQHRLALESKARLESLRILKEPIVTEIVPASTFYPAEDYHQDFHRKNPARYREYELGSGRDRRLEEIWGPPAHRAGR